MDDSNRTLSAPAPYRRRLLRAAGAWPLPGATSMGLLPAVAFPAALTQAQRDAMTLDQVIAMMRQGNERILDLGIGDVFNARIAGRSIGRKWLIVRGVPRDRECRSLHQEETA